MSYQERAHHMQEHGAEVSKKKGSFETEIQQYGKNSTTDNSMISHKT